MVVAFSLADDHPTGRTPAISLSTYGAVRVLVV